MERRAEGLSAATRWALAVGCAISVGNLYYIQPLLAGIAREFRVTEGKAGLAATLAQVGYALGMLLVVPLGDIRERRGLIMTTLSATVIAALAMSAAPSFGLLCVASLVLGFATCTPQILIPFAAALASPEARGRTVGFVMSGLLLGILLARTFSGFVGARLGWRAVYVLASVLVAALAVALRRLLPENREEGRVSYVQLLRSLGDLVREEPILRESAAYGALLFAAFSAFWTTLAFLLRPRGMGPDTVGLFGLVGAAGALAAPLAGRLSDRGSPRRAILAGILTVIVSFGVMLQGSIPALIVGVLLMDIGVQGAQVSNQSRIYALRPEARSRLNTVYMTCYFVGGALGSALGAWLWSVSGWPGVCALGAGCGFGALVVFGATARRAERSASA